MSENKPQENSAPGEQNVIIEEKITKVNGETTVKKYMKGKLLGKGGFAKCYEVTNLESKKTQAAKIIPKASLAKNRARQKVNLIIWIDYKIKENFRLYFLKIRFINNPQKLISEIKIHKSLHHMHIVDFEHVFEDHENVYILLEVCQNQTLNELLKRRKRLTELEVQTYLMQIITALKYLTNNKVIHRDLKLGNLFLNEKLEIKLGDFGLATKLEFDGEKKRTICGTPNYIAPEILDGKCGHSYEVDIWSLGVIIYTLIIGKPPFETPDVKTTYKKIKMNSYSFPEHVPISDAARNLITKILILEPTKRPTLDEILQHQFLNNGGTIPRILPLSTLACPPSANFIKQYIPSGNVQRSTMKTDNPLGISSKSNLALGNIKYKKDNNNIDFEIRPTTTQKDPIMSSQQKSNQNYFQQTLNANNQIKPKPNTFKNEVYVKKWVDYSSKYGLGYLLSNGSTGVFFNDSTKIISHPKNLYFEYMEKKYNEKQDDVKQYTFDTYPKEIQKKVTLLHHFKNYLDSEGNQPEIEEDYKNQPLVYLKKWMKTRHAILFRQSNKIVQVNFTDKTEVILSSEHKMLTYVNKKAERTNYPLATALESTNTEMTKRLKYTKEILAHMLNNPQADKNINLQEQQ